MADIITDRCRRVREQLVERYGGLEGLLQKLETMDRAREQSVVAHRRKLARVAQGAKPKRQPAARSA